MITLRSIPSSFYVVGGTLQRDAACYVPRRSDAELLAELRRAEFCYVLTSRQMGKSSLMVRTAVTLREEGVAVAVLDITAVGRNLTPDQWYAGLLALVGQQLDLEEELEEFWQMHARLAPVQRWMQALRTVVLVRCPGQVTLFLDEIDAVRSLPFSTDEFFAAIRECYNRRTEDGEMSRLTFCLLGVATPADLIQDTRTTPFNIGKRIELFDFEPAEARILAQGLGGVRSELLLRRVLYWTGGQPYLTQRLCAEAAAAGAATPAAIDRVCRELFLSSRARERDDNLLYVRERLLRSEVDRASLLDLYQRTLRRRHMRDDETNPLVSVLTLSGIVAASGGRLRVRNMIYRRVFDRSWVRTNMPDAELRRLARAFRRGLLRAGLVAAVIVAAIGTLAMSLHREAQRADLQARLYRGMSQVAEQNYRKAQENALRAERAAVRARMSARVARAAEQAARRSADARLVALKEKGRESQRARAAEARARNAHFTAARAAGQERTLRAQIQDLLAQRNALDLRGVVGSEQGVIMRLAGKDALTGDQQNLDPALHFYRHSLEIYRKLGNKQDIAQALAGIGKVEIKRGHWEVARQMLYRARAVEQQLAPDSLELAVIVNDLGFVALQEGNLTSAREQLEQALHIRERRAPNSLALAVSLDNIGALMYTQGDRNAAANYLQRALDIQARLSPNSNDTASTLNNLGVLTRDQSNFAQSADYHRRALTILEKIAPNTHSLAWTLDALGTATYEAGDPATARDYLLRAVAIEEKIGPDSQNLATVLTNLGSVAIKLNQYERARDYYGRAAALLEKLGNRREAAHLRERLDQLAAAPAASHQTAPAATQ